MSDQIPNSISFDALNELQAEAPAEREHVTKPGSLSFCEMENICRSMRDDLAATVNDPLGFKILAMMMLADLQSWHIHMSELHREECGVGSGQAWMLDAGHLQMMRHALIDIEVGHNDPTPSYKRQGCDECDD